MQITIHARPQPPKPGDFQYGNIESPYGVNTQYFTKNGKPFLPVAGELHFSRLPRERWREALLAMRECGVNTVSTYVFWNHHNEEKGKFDFSGNRDIAAFLSLCRSLSLPVVLRIGPWCHGEVVRGGFPKRIARMPRRRTDAPRYLAAVREYWQRLFCEVESFLDGETVIGLQLENEYTGPTSHLRTLRRLAEDIGFRVPFFTMTAWPSGVPDREFLPMAGGYPDAPWARGKKALAPNNRFAITPARSEDEIGADLLRGTRRKTENAYRDVPYASCEIGPGNQVTQHRRPYISEKDGWGVGFAKFASGMNWLGYYMFCGGANPPGSRLEENRRTGYPNNYPVIDYDFQAPISRYGECRPHGDRLRLLHLFAESFEPDICTMQPFFPKWPSASPRDTSFLKCSVRVNDAGYGYFFCSTYEKGLSYPDFSDVRVRVQLPEKTVELPALDIPAGSIFFYPFGIRLGRVRFDYILAQPIAKTVQNGETTCWFLAVPGVSPRYSVGGREYAAPVTKAGVRVEDVRLCFLPDEAARQFHLLRGEARLISGTVLQDGEQAFAVRRGADIAGTLDFAPCSARRLPCAHELYSHGKRRYYRLKLPGDILTGRKDVELEFAFSGLNVQVFSGQTLLNDHFNIDSRFRMRLREYQSFLERDDTLVFRTVPRTRFGVSNVYCEKPLPLYENTLRLLRASVIEAEEL